ncbi:hypothetical protein N0V82_007605 [Gnomoniopsis sp. IMI 355080]|nr:hypothetical protein N0V82_007605 [Gnomoniopsis sp. IMI 355080]
MFVDSMVDNRNERLADEWLNDFALDPDNQAKLVEFVRTSRPGFSLPKMIHNGIRGSYNVNWRLEFEDGLSTMIHVPIPHAVAFPDEKIRAEVAAMKLVRDNTTIPVPEVYGWGTAVENPTGYGPFIVMEYIKHTKSLEHVILHHIKSVERSGMTKRRSDKTQSDKTLLKAYRQMANIMLQLSTIEGTAIGYPSLPKPPKASLLAPSSSASSPTEVPISNKSHISGVNHRAISQSTNDLVTMGGTPPSVLSPSHKTYNTAEYYQAMADMHLAHLAFQHNNAVLSRPDGREKYVARQLFRKLAREGRLAGEKRVYDKDVFKLWCDDMRPASVLLDDNDDVVGVIDWEMSYFAPASFHNNLPWWLIVDKPEFYEKGLSSWVKEYERHLPLFLQAMDMEEAELRGTREETRHVDGALHRRRQPGDTDEAGEDGRSSGQVSKRMKQNWENREFFVDYCARRNYGFDPIYWKYVDEKFFGKNKKTALLLQKGGYKGRQHLLSEKERAQMEPFISWKLEDREDEKIVEWDEKDARAILAACLAGTLGDIDIPKPRLIPWTMTDRSPSPSGPAGT